MLWLQQDAAQIVRDKLRDVIPDGAEFVRAELPEGWTPRAGPVCTVHADGSQAAPPGTDRELVRVTVRAEDQPRARRIMTEIDAFLTTPGFHFLGFSISRNRGTGLLSGPDSLVGGYFASATYEIATSRKRKVMNHGTSSQP